MVNGTTELQDGTGSIGGAGPSLQPMQCAVVVDLDRGRVGVGVVNAELFDVTAVSLGAGICSDEVVEGFSFLTVALES